MFILFVKFSRPYIYSLPYVYYGLQSINIYFVLNIFLNLTFSPFSIHDYNDRPQGGLVIIVQIKTNMKNKQMAKKRENYAPALTATPRRKGHSGLNLLCSFIGISPCSQQIKRRLQNAHLTLSLPPAISELKFMFSKKATKNYKIFTV